MSIILCVDDEKLLSHVGLLVSAGLTHVSAVNGSMARGLSDHVGVRCDSSFLLHLLSYPLTDLPGLYIMQLGGVPRVSRNAQDPWRPRSTTPLKTWPLGECNHKRFKERETN